MYKTILEITNSNFSLGTAGVGDVAEGDEEILLTVRNMIMTPKGSIPGRYEKGSNIFLYQDRPLSVAVPGIVSSIFDVIEKWEPRLEVKSVQNYVDDQLGFVHFVVNLTVIRTSRNIQYEFDYNYKSPSGRAFSDGYNDSFQ